MMGPRVLPKRILKGEIITNVEEKIKVLQLNTNISLLSQLIKYQLR